MGAQIHGKQLLQVNVQGTTKNLLVLRDNGTTRLFDAHPLVEGFNVEYGTNLKVVSHGVADVALNFGETWRSLPAFAVDASIAYEKPGIELGNEIVFAAERGPRVVLATGKYKGERDVALVALGLSALDFKPDGDSIVLDIHEDRLIVVRDFPGLDGYYLPHPETGVPQGRQIGPISDSRYLYSLTGSSYVGLLVRNFTHSKRYVNAAYRASNRLGVVAEVPEYDVGLINVLIAQTATPQACNNTVLQVSGYTPDELRDLAGKAQSAAIGLIGTVSDETLAPILQLAELVARSELK